MPTVEPTVTRDGEPGTMVFYFDTFVDRGHTKLWELAPWLNLYTHYESSYLPELKGVEWNPEKEKWYVTISKFRSSYFNAYLPHIEGAQRVGDALRLLGQVLHLFSFFSNKTFRPQIRMDRLRVQGKGDLLLPWAPLLAASETDYVEEFLPILRHLVANMYSVKGERDARRKAVDDLWVTLGSPEWEAKLANLDVDERVKTLIRRLRTWSGDGFPTPEELGFPVTGYIRQREEVRSSSSSSSSVELPVSSSLEFKHSREDILVHAGRLYSRVLSFATNADTLSPDSRKLIQLCCILFFWDLYVPRYHNTVLLDYGKRMNELLVKLNMGRYEQSAEEYFHLMCESQGYDLLR